MRGGQREWKKERGGEREWNKERGGEKRGSICHQGIMNVCFTAELISHCVVYYVKVGLVFG